jgi:hypothetical protein
MILFKRVAHETFNFSSVNNLQRSVYKPGVSPKVSALLHDVEGSESNVIRCDVSNLQAKILT